MSFSVKRSSRVLVKPLEQTPSGTLDLSGIDKIPVLRCNARTLHVFKHGPAALQVIRAALSKALVHYYPLAGRLKANSSQGEAEVLQIECCADGVWLVEAYADCTLQDVNYYDESELVPYDELLPDQVPRIEGSEPLVQMQVTQFACDGFVIGLIFCHTICDGLGAAQFLKAIGELARGYNHLTITPVWHRDFCSRPISQQPTSSTFSNLPPMPSYNLSHTNIDIYTDQIDKLKRQFHESTGQTCSAFEIVAASFWRGRTKAVNFTQNTEVKLVFFASCRHILSLPEGFYGNCFFPVTIEASSDSLARASIVDVVKLIKQAKDKLPIEFSMYLKGDYLMTGEDPFAPPLVYTTLFISEWGRLGFNQVDYGWGPPVHVVPIQGSSIIPVGIVGSLPLPKKGVRLMTWCVEEAHREPFINLMSKLP